jgi:PAS domain S-box-containing protein
VGYFTLSEAGLILEANLTAATLLQVPRGALARQRFSSFIYSEDQDIHYLRRKQLLETGAPQSWELRLLRKDSDPFWARIEAATAWDTDGASVWRAIVTDITAEKRADQLTQAHCDELHEFAATLSHDIQEPLRTVLNLTQVLTQEHKGKLGETTDTYFAHCLESATKMDVLLKGLLNYLHYRAR